MKKINLLSHSECLQSREMSHECPVRSEKQLVQIIQNWFHLRDESKYLAANKHQQPRLKPEAPKPPAEAALSQSHRLPGGSMFTARYKNCSGLQISFIILRLKFCIIRGVAFLTGRWMVTIYFLFVKNVRLEFRF